MRYLDISTPANFPDDPALRDAHTRDLLDSVITHHLKGERVDVAKIANLKVALTEIIEKAYLFTPPPVDIYYVEYSGGPRKKVIAATRKGDDGHVMVRCELPDGQEAEFKLACGCIVDANGWASNLPASPVWLSLQDQMA